MVTTLTFPAYAQAPDVTEIQPSQGPAEGGTRVIIRGDNLSVPVQCVLPCPPIVEFGGIEVEAVAETDERLVVTTPAHEAGTVDVTIFIPGRETVTIDDGFTFLAGADAGYEQILLPIYIRQTVPGANGTQWKTDFRIRNDGRDTVQLAPWDCADNLACPPVFPLTYFLQPRTTLRNPRDFGKISGTNPSRLLYVSAPADVSMSLRVADVSSNAMNAGTEIPVVRSSEMRRGTINLLNVPLTDQNFRVLLRIYEVAYDRSEFTVTFHPDVDNSDLPPYSVNLVASSPWHGPFRAEAAYVQFDVSELVHLRRAWPELVRIEIEPRTAGSRYWAFASITNNETQLVTLATPQ
jgi:hypothetical protein